MKISRNIIFIEAEKIKLMKMKSSGNPWIICLPFRQRQRKVTSNLSFSSQYEIVNENSFSKGEKQLLAFARAIAKDTSIYIFDEPTSNIDVKNEQTIKNIISEVLKDSTVIIIAHRPTTIENVDKILKVQNKKVVVKSRKTIAHINNMEKFN